MKLHRPLHVCAYFFGVFPMTVEDSSRVQKRFRVHWPGVALKAFHTLFYWFVTFVISVVYIRNLYNYQKHTKKALIARVLNVDELFVYMIFVTMVTTTVCQAHFLWPSVTRAMNECFFELRRLDDVTGVWQNFTAFTVVLFVVYELAIYFILIPYKLVVVGFYFYLSETKERFDFATKNE